MATLADAGRKTYGCRTCDAQFIVPRNETAVCCPICRMNRIELRE